MNLSDVFQQLDQLLAQKDWEKAESLLKGCLDQAQPDSQAALTLTNELTELYRKAGRPAEALPTAASALAMAERMGYGQAGLYVTLLQNAASACLEAGHTEPGLDYAQKAERFCREHAMEASEERAAALETLSRLCQQQEQYGQALEWQKEALELARARHSQDPADVGYGAALAALADLYYRASRYEYAVSTYEEALEEIQRVTGDSELFRVTRQNMLLALAAARL